LTAPVLLYPQNGKFAAFSLVQFAHTLQQGAAGWHGGVPNGLVGNLQRRVPRGYEYAGKRTSQQSRNPTRSARANDPRTLRWEGGPDHFPVPRKRYIQCPLPRLRVCGDLVAGPNCRPNGPIAKRLRLARAATILQLLHRILKVCPPSITGPGSKLNRHITPHHNCWDPGTSATRRYPSNRGLVSLGPMGS
jgi:hypothetical protein